MNASKVKSKQLLGSGSEGIKGALLIFFAVALQVQVTLLANDNYLGLRIGLSDLLLPLTGIAVLTSLLFKKSFWPKWSLKHAYWWLVLLIAVMTLATALGSLSSWAFINKYIGFLILCCYFLLGGWIAQNVRNALPLFMRWFCAFFVLTVAVSTIFVSIQSFIPFSLWLSNFSWDGFIANRNSFMVVCVFAMISFMMTRKDFTLSSSLWVHHLFWLLLPIFCLYNASRTGWIIFAVLLVIYFCRDTFAKMKAILPLLLIGVVGATISFYTSPIPMIEKTRQFAILTSGLEAPETEGEMYIGDKQRLIAVEDGLELYLQSNPLTGAGIGNYRLFQEEKRGGFVNIIDFTALWLLVETGLLGLISFAAFFIACTYKLYQRGYNRSYDHDHSYKDYYKTVFVFLIAFAAITLTHELMYTRFVWFVLGLSLAGAIPKQKT